MTGLTVKNGTIAGLGSAGVFALGEINRFENLTLWWNGGTGLQVTGLGTQVVNVNSSWNGGRGICVGQGGECPPVDRGVEQVRRPLGQRRRPLH